MARTIAGTRTTAGTRTAITGQSALPSEVSGLSLWFKADAITGLVNDDPVSTWSDSSDNGNDATQTLTARPLYKTNILNGLPVVRFDGSNDIMNIANSPTVGSVFVVSNWRGAALFPADFRGMFGRAAGGRSVLFGRNAESNIGSTLTNGTTLVRVNGGSTSSIRSYLQYLTHKICYVETTVPISGESGWYIASGDAANKFWNGDIAEVIVYSVQLSTENRQLVEKYLSKKYAIPVGNVRLISSTERTSI